MALPRAVGPSFLDDSAEELYDIPSGNVFHAKQITLCNQDVVARTVTLHNVANAGSPTASNAFLHEAEIPAGTTMQLDLDMAFDGSIHALADEPDLVTCSIDGLLMTSANEMGLYYLPRVRGFIPNAAASMWTADGLSMVKHIVVCNTDDSSHDFSIWRRPGVPAIDDSMLVLTRTLAAHRSFFMSVEMVLPDGGQLWADADAPSVLTMIASAVGTDS